MTEVANILMELALAVVAVAVPVILGSLFPPAKAALKAIESNKYSEGLAKSQPLLYSAIRGMAVKYLDDVADTGLEFAEKDLIPAVKKFAQDEADSIRYKTNIRIGDTDQAIDALVAEAVAEARKAYRES